jgi:hypothetical protein
MKTRPVRASINWVRGPAQIQGGEIVIVGDPEEYWPINHQGLAFDLAGAGDPERLIEFVERWGLLHHGDPQGELREDVSKMQESAHTFRTLLETYSVLQQASRKEPGGMEALRSLRKALALYFESPAASDDELKFQASRMIAWRVSKGLRNVGSGLDAASRYISPEGETYPEDSFLLAARPNDLLGYAYHDLAMTLARSEPARRCEECGRTFRVTHKRQKFCDERCAGRARYRRWAQKRKEG